MMPIASLLAAALLASAPASAATDVARAAIATDPPHDTAHPAALQVLRIPTGGVEVNGIAYVPSGAGPHPILLILHGLPGNERNFDLAQAARRAGWVAVVFNYRGSWGSPGRFAFENVLADADAALAYLRKPDVATRLRADPARIVLAGHSMGGWATAITAAHDHALRGAVLISAANIGGLGAMSRDKRVAFMADNRESLNASAEEMADQLAALPPSRRLAAQADGLAKIPLLVLSSNDGLAPATDALIAATRAAGNTRVTAQHVATDHSWSDRRIALETAVIDWIAALR